MELDLLPSLEARLSVIETILTQIQGMLASPREAREWYTVEEVAEMLSKTPYTVRE